MMSNCVSVQVAASPKFRRLRQHENRRYLRPTWPVTDRPECDLLLIAGDICPVHNHKLFYQDIWLRSCSTRGRAQRAKWIIGVWGNHDWIGEKQPPELPWRC